MDSITEKMPGKHFWGIMIPGAITALLLYYSSLLVLPSLMMFVPVNTVVKTILFITTSYIFGLIIMRLASKLERYKYLKNGDSFPAASLLEQGKYGLWLQLFNQVSHDRLGYHIKESADKNDFRVDRNNTVNFFRYCRYLVTKNNLADKTDHLQAEYFLFRNLSFTFLMAVPVLLLFVILKAIDYPPAAEAVLQKIEFYHLLIAALIAGICCWKFFTAGLEMRKKFTLDTYRIAYYLLKNI
jgi:hypothetical protein